MGLRPVQVRDCIVFTTCVRFRFASKLKIGDVTTQPMEQNLGTAKEPLSSVNGWGNVSVINNATETKDC